MVAPPDSPFSILISNINSLRLGEVLNDILQRHLFSKGANVIEARLTLSDKLAKAWPDLVVSTYAAE
jgi:hypothetical protein